MRFQFIISEVLCMGKFIKGVVMGAVAGAAIEMVVMPQLDRKTQRNVKKAARRMRHMAGSTYDGIQDWIR